MAEIENVGVVTSQEMCDFLIILMPNLPDLETALEGMVGVGKGELSQDKISEWLETHDYSTHYIHRDIQYLADNEYDLNECNNECFKFNCEIESFINFQGGSYIAKYKKIDEKRLSAVVQVNADAASVTIIEF